jgi:hypothetical protein
MENWESLQKNETRPFVSGKNPVTKPIVTNPFVMAAMI